MKKLDPHLTILWILGIIAVIYFTGEFYNYNESWNKIRRQGLKPVLASADKVSNDAVSHAYQEIYKEVGITNNYWNPYIFSGMPNVFGGVQHFFVMFIYRFTGLRFSQYWHWCYVIDALPLFFVLWLVVLKPPKTPEQIATNKEDQKICKSLFLLIAGWLVFYWFYAEVR